jgi:hypothetical protein
MGILAEIWSIVLFISPLTHELLFQTEVHEQGLAGTSTSINLYTHTHIRAHDTVHGSGGCSTPGWARWQTRNV